MLKDHNAVTLVRLEPAASRSRVKHPTTEPLIGYGQCCFITDFSKNCVLIQRRGRVFHRLIGIGSVISSAEVVDNFVAIFTSLARARD